MRVVALEPFLAETAHFLVGMENLVGVSHNSDFPEEVKKGHHVTQSGRTIGLQSRSKTLAERLSSSLVDVDRLLDAKPDVVITKLPHPDDLGILREELASVSGRKIALFHHDPIRLDEVYDMFDNVGKEIGVPEKGKALSQRVKAQVMDWCSNFYDRIRNKRVALVTSVNPLLLGGRWIPDMIRAASGHPQAMLAQEEDQRTSWEAIVKYNPDVLVIAPKNAPYPESLSCFEQFEKLPRWEEIYAVKRGDVFFTDGTSFFNHPTPRLIESMGILISAMAGLESGYITARDAMYRLRYLELHRHKFAAPKQNS